MRESGSYKNLKEIVLKKVSNSKTKLLLLDFDGTLVDFSDKIAGAVPTEELLLLLKRLAAITGLHLVIISGRSRNTIEHLFNGLKVDIVAEHGAIIRENGEWKNSPEINDNWRSSVMAVVAKFASALPESMIEEKTFSIAWHYRSLERKTGRENSKQLIREINSLSKILKLRIIDGNKVVEITSEKINKGSATQYLLSKQNYDFILCIGDDRTDEDMFRILAGNPNALTIKTGRGKTSAGYSLTNVRQVNRLLEQLLPGMEYRVRNSLNNTSPHEN